MYQVFLGAMQLPVTPSKIEMTINNKNETVDLINDGQINILRSAGLTDISFEFMIPAQTYPFVNLTGMLGGLKQAAVGKAILKYLEYIKTNKTPVQFIVVRTIGNAPLSISSVGAGLWSNLTVSLEDYTITDDAENGFDLIVSVNLKQYKHYSTKLLNSDGTVSETRK